MGKKHWPARGEASIRPGGLWSGPWSGTSACGLFRIQYWPRYARDVTCKTCLKCIDVGAIDRVIERGVRDRLGLS